MRMSVVTLASILALGATRALAAAPTPAGSTAPTATSTPVVMRERAPRPRPSCPPGTRQVGPEDQDCSAFGDCCKAEHKTPAN